jgi:hypothetical protein
MSLLQSLRPNTTPPQKASCPPDMSAQVDELTNTLMERDQTIQQQQQTLNQLQGEIPNIKQNLNNLNNNVQSNYTIIQSENKKFYVTYLALALLALFMFIIYIYNLLLINNIMPELKKKQLLNTWAAILSGGNNKIQGGVDGDGDDSIKARKAEWEEFMTVINTYLSRSRFFLFLVMYGMMIGITVFMYSIIYRGTNTSMAASRSAVALLLVMGFTFLFVNNDSMIRPFENVFGSMFVNMTNRKYVQETMRGIFQHKYFTSETIFPEATMYFDFMLNAFSLKNIPDVIFDIFYKDNKYDFKINQGGNQEDEGVSANRLENLFKYVLQKHTIGHSCWVYFASLAGCIISMKYLLATMN